jgi:hypothetical protein
MADETKPVLSVRAALQTILDKSVAVLQRHIEPDGGLSDHDALSQLYGIFDGPDYRAAKAALAAPFGVTVEQEPKYTTCPDTGSIINRATGKPIPPDEPIMIFRAKDPYAREVLRRYHDLIINLDGRFAASCFERSQRFIAFAERNPARMRKPD